MGVGRGVMVKDFWMFFYSLIIFQEMVWFCESANFLFHPSLWFNMKPQLLPQYLTISYKVAVKFP